MSRSLLNSLIGKVSLGLLGGQASIPALGAVQNLAITGASGGEVADLTPTLTWDAPVDDSYGAPDSYTVRYADNELFNDSTTVTGVAVTNYTLTTQPNATYLYAQVWAIRGSITGATATAVSALMLVALTRDDYTADAASLAGTRTPDGGGSNYTFTDSGAKLSVANHELTPTGSATGANDPKSADSHARAAGRTYSVRLKVGATGTGGNAFDIGWNSSTNVWGLRHNGAEAAYNVRQGAGVYNIHRVAAALDEYDLLSFVELGSAGFAVFVNRELVWITNRATADPMIAYWTTLAASRKIPYLDQHLIYDLDGEFSSIGGLALVDEASPTTGVEYVGSGSDIIHQWFTPEAGSLTSERDIKFRKSAAVAGVDPDYDRVYTNTSGDLCYQQYLAGVGQGETVLASGIITAGTGIGVMVIAAGSFIRIFTYSSAFLYTARGSEITDGVLNNNAIVEIDAGDGTIGQLWVHPTQSDVYERLNPGFATPATYTADDFGEVAQLVTENADVALEAGRHYHFGELQEIRGHGNLYIHSDTPGSKVYIHKDTIDDTYHTYTSGMSLFNFTNASNVHFKDIVFVGLHTSGWSNASAGSAIIINGSACNNWVIEDCEFQDIVGFPFEGLGYSSGLIIRNCTVNNCGNGINFANDGAEVYNVTFTESEGLEVLGEGIYIHDITITDAVGAGISLGGDVGLRVSHDCIIEDVTINTVVTSGVALIVADNITDAIIRRVNVNNASFGFSCQVTGGYTTETHGVLFQDCVAVECGQGFYFPASTRIDGLEVDTCTSTNADYYGLNCADPDANVHGSSFTGSGTKDVLLQASSAGMTFAGDNTYGTILDQR